MSFNKTATPKGSLVSLLHEANNDPMMNISERRELSKKTITKLLKQTKPITSKNEIVGFYMPGESLGGNPKMSNIYLKKEYRSKGHGYRVAKRFVNQNPNTVWFTNEKNTPSINLAKKIGLKLKDSRKRGDQNILMFKGNMNKQAFLEETYNSAFNDELEKIALSTKLYSSVIGELAPDLLEKSYGGGRYLSDIQYWKKPLRRAAEVLLSKRNQIRKIIRNAK